MCTSVGITMSNDRYQSPEEVLRDADTAMYRAKAKGKGRYELFQAPMHTKAFSLLQLENDLRRGIQRNEFRVFYQPIIDLGGTSVASFESLVRWFHPQRGMVPPDVFIPLAEETGLIVAIGESVLKESCIQMKQWIAKHGCTKMRVGVNLSARQFLQGDLVENVTRILEETKLSPDNLTLEMTESVFLPDAINAAAVLKKLRELRVRVMVDDFGTGYSSLSYLHQFEFDALKIDKSFISGVDPELSNAEIVRTIIALGRNLHKTIVAEGVETRIQAEKLRDMGCTYGQGYYFSRPLGADAISQWFAGDQSVGSLVGLNARR